MKEALKAKIAAVKDDIATWCELGKLLSLYKLMEEDLLDDKDTAEEVTELSLIVLRGAIEDCSRERDILYTKHKGAFDRMDAVLAGLKGKDAVTGKAEDCHPA